MILRNTHPAFSLDGKIDIEANGNRLKITRSFGEDSIILDADLTTYEFEIKK
jgi:sucrose phosphorylase